MTGLFLVPLMALGAVAACPDGDCACNCPCEVRVEATGEIATKPDHAVVRLGVRTEGQTAAEAFEVNNTGMAATQAALEALGVEKKYIKTVRFRLEPIYTRATREAPPVLQGYGALHELSVKVMDVDRLGLVLDASVGAGSVYIMGINFGVENADELMAQARVEAIKAAEAKACLLAETAGAKLGQVKLIAEQGQPRGGMDIRMMMAGGGAPVAPGETNVSVSVVVIYRLDCGCHVVEP